MSEMLRKAKRWYRRFDAGLTSEAKAARRMLVRVATYASSAGDEPLSFELERWNGDYEGHFVNGKSQLAFWGAHSEDPSRALVMTLDDVMGIGECGPSFSLKEYVGIDLCAKSVAELDVRLHAYGF